MLGVLAPEVGMARACRVLGVARTTAYRHRDPTPPRVSRPRRPPPLALSAEGEEPSRPSLTPSASPMPARPRCTPPSSTRGRTLWE